MTSSPALFLPGPIPDRTIWEGWNRWRLTRRNFVPAPVITAGAHARMTPRQRRLHDLHRIATHSNLLIQETPMSAFISWKVRALIEDNAFNHSPGTRPGVMINGGAARARPRRSARSSRRSKTNGSPSTPRTLTRLPGRWTSTRPSPTSAPR
jgi:hypothetical protein